MRYKQGIGEKALFPLYLRVLTQIIPVVSSDEKLAEPGIHRRLDVAEFLQNRTILLYIYSTAINVVFWTTKTSPKKLQSGPKGPSICSNRTCSTPNHLHMNQYCQIHKKYIYILSHSMKKKKKVISLFTIDDNRTRNLHTLTVNVYPWQLRQLAGNRSESNTIIHKSLEFDHLCYI